MKIEFYIENMFYFPCYKGERIDEDIEFVYYKVSVPHVYFEWHNMEYNKWTEDPPDADRIPKEEDAIILGVSFIPIYRGVEELEVDDKFKYYKVRVPKIFMNHVNDKGISYMGIYDELESKFDIKEQEEQPSIGELLKDKAEEEVPTLSFLRVSFRCTNPECTDPVFKDEITSDLFDTLYQKKCEACGCQIIHIDKIVNLADKEDEGEDG